MVIENLFMDGQAAQGRPTGFVIIFIIICFTTTIIISSSSTTTTTTTISVTLIITIAIRRRRAVQPREPASTGVCPRPRWMPGTVTGNNDSNNSSSSKSSKNSSKTSNNNNSSNNNSTPQRQKAPNVPLPCLQKDLRRGSISRDMVNFFPSELCRRRSGMFTEVACLVPPGLRRWRAPEVLLLLILLSWLLLLLEYRKRAWDGNHNYYYLVMIDMFVLLCYMSLVMIDLLFGNSFIISWLMTMV